VIGFEQWKKHLKDLNINRNIGILKEKYVVSLDYIMNLDIIEARHQLDNLVCYSGLKDTTFYDLQKGLGLEPTLQKVENFMQHEYNQQLIQQEQLRHKLGHGLESAPNHPAQFPLVYGYNNQMGMPAMSEVVMGIPSHNGMYGEPQDFS
jgi:hypothetical protein